MALPSKIGVLRNTRTQHLPGRFSVFNTDVSSGDYTPPPPADSFYLRPDGTSYYLRPDGTSYYLRP